MKKETLTAKEALTVKEILTSMIERYEAKLKNKS